MIHLQFQEISWKNESEAKIAPSPFSRELVLNDSKAKQTMRKVAAERLTTYGLCLLQEIALLLQKPAPQLQCKINRL